MSNRITMLLQNTPGLEGLFTSANKPYPINIKTRHSILETYKDDRPTYIKKTYDAFGLENLD